MESRELFESNLSTIDTVVATVCRRARLHGADAEDFASSVRVALLEDDCAVLRKYEGRSSLAAYLSVVVQRLLFDERVHSIGRFYASAEATRIGPAAVLIEKLVRRDRRSFDDAWPIVSAGHPEVTREEAERIVERLPERAPRTRLVELDAEEVPPLAASETADERALAAERKRLSDRTARAIRQAMASYSAEDRTILRLRYGCSRTIADVSRMLRLPQRPLYRRIETLLARLRSALLEEGIDAAEVQDLICGVIEEDLDLGLPATDATQPPTLPFVPREAAGEGP